MHRRQAVRQRQGRGSYLAASPKEKCILRARHGRLPRDHFPAMMKMAHQAWVFAYVEIFQLQTQAWVWTLPVQAPHRK